MSIPLNTLTEDDGKRILELEQEEKLLSTFEGYASKIESNKENIKYLTQEIMELEMSRGMLEGDIKNLTKVNDDLLSDMNSVTEPDMDGLNFKLMDLTAKYHEIKNKLEMANTADQDVKDLTQKRDELLAKSKKDIEEKECLEIAKDAFGSTGIKTVVIDYLIPRLEYRINEILSKMSDFKIRLETQKSKFDGEGMTEGLFINIYNEMGECFSLANYSGGQKLKIHVAISEALATMQKVGFRIFDEIFVGLDESSIEGFNEVMNSLQEKFSQMLCISHLRTIQDSFEERITIIKEGDTSKIM
jgi:DNA repair exonuclease SbcCD ATPase subunit